MKLIVILGPTASGKTALSVKLAKKYQGQIISADSRQVYRGLNIGAGKVTKQEMASIPHYLLDVANPKRKFSVARYQKLALAAIKQIQAQKKMPFLVGGTGFYIQAIVDGMVIPPVKPNWKLRKSLKTKSTNELLLILKKLDPRRAKAIDQKNPVRLIRAIEIISATQKPITPLQKNPQYEVLQLGIKKSRAELRALIKKRLKKRTKGIITEVKKLHTADLSWKRLEELGLEYRFAARYLQRKITYDQMISELQKEIEHFAKRQMTWFRRDKRICWIKNQRQAEILIKKFLS